MYPSQQDFIIFPVLKVSKNNSKQLIFIKMYYFNIVIQFWWQTVHISAYLEIFEFTKQMYFDITILCVGLCPFSMKYEVHNT